MATYKTVSTQTIIRKVMRDLAPDDANWIHDAVEWIGEALEHIGAGAHVETKGCILDIDDFKGTLPPDVYYINQVAVNDTEQESLQGKIDDLQALVREVGDVTTVMRNSLANTVTQLQDGTITSNLSKTQLELFGTLGKVKVAALNKIIADSCSNLHVLHEPNHRKPYTS